MAGVAGRSGILVRPASALAGYGAAALRSAKAVWTRMDPPKPWPTGGNAWRDNRSCAYDEADNAVLWMPNDGAVWACRCR